MKTGESKLLEYEGHLVECAVPYDDTRKIAVGQAHGNVIRQAISVSEAIEQTRSQRRAKLLTAVRGVADDLANGLSAVMASTKASGVLNLEELLGDWKPVERKLITGELTALGKECGGMSKAAAANERLAQIAWRHVKARELPGYVWAGTFSQREASGLMESSGLTCFDFDKVGGSLDEFVKRLLDDPLVFWFTRSPSLTGVKVIVRIPDDAAYNPKKYLACWETFQRYVRAKYSEVSMAIDQAAKAVSQLCFYPSDPEAPDPMDSYILHPDADLMALHVEGLKPKKNQAKAKASTPGSASAEEPESKPTKVPARAPMLSKGKGGPMDNYTEGQQAATIVEALESLDRWLSELPSGTGEANKAFSSLGYAVGDWCRGVEDADAAGAVQDKLRALMEAHYARSADVVERAMSSANGEITLGTLFNMAKAHGNWVPPWSRQEARQAARFAGGNGDGGVGVAETEEERAQRVAAEALKCEAHSIGELSTMEIDESQTLLGDRFVCRGGAMLFQATSGIGKSTAILQACTLWSCGREAFGIKPTRPLRILITQAENDNGDLTEDTRDLAVALKLSMEEQAMVSANTLVVTVKKMAGPDYITTVRAWLEKARLENAPFDLFVVEPFNRYLGGDVNDAKAMLAFCHVWLTDLMDQFACGAVVVHHAPKMRGARTDQWKPSDYVHFGAGRAELSNWARAILNVEATYDSNIYKFHASKRGTRLGWTDFWGEPTLVKYFAYGGEGKIYWREATQAEVLAAEEKEKQNKNQNKKKYPDALFLRILAVAGGRLSFEEYWGRVEAETEMVRRTFCYRVRALVKEGKLAKNGDVYEVSANRSGAMRNAPLHHNDDDPENTDENECNNPMSGRGSSTPSAIVQQPPTK